MSKTGYLYLIDLFILFVFAIALSVVGSHAWNKHIYQQITKNLLSKVSLKEPARVGIPFEMRDQVSSFLNQKITPVLYHEERLSLQFFSVHQVPAAIMREDVLQQFPDVSSHTSTFKNWHLVFFDLEKAALTPLRSGEEIPIEYSRPFLYSPLYESTMLNVNEHRQFHYVLTEGSYRFSVEAFVRNKKNESVIEIAVKSHNRAIEQSSFTLKRVVENPFRLDFRFDLNEEQRKGTKSKEVIIDLIHRSTSETKTKAVIHRVSLEML